MILRASEVRPAEARCREQRASLANLLQMDTVKAENPADTAMCVRMLAAAANDPKEYENLLSRPEVNRLFCRGALYFKIAESTPAPASAPTENSLLKKGR